MKTVPLSLLFTSDASRGARTSIRVLILLENDLNAIISTRIQIFPFFVLTPVLASLVKTGLYNAFATRKCSEKRRIWLTQTERNETSKGEFQLCCASISYPGGENLPHSRYTTNSFVTRNMRAMRKSVDFADSRSKVGPEKFPRQTLRLRSIGRIPE